MKTNKQNDEELNILREELNALVAQCLKEGAKFEDNAEILKIVNQINEYANT